jgi:hypothetical protein
VKVAVGDKVRAGQAIAQVGTSGSSLFPHCITSLARARAPKARVCRRKFVSSIAILGSTRARADGTSPDSGDIVEDR